MNDQIPQFRLIDKANDLSAFVSGEQYILSGIHITNTGTEASNGRVLIRCPFPRVDVDSFPATPTPTSEAIDGSIVRADALKLAHKTLPKVPLFPSAACVRISKQKEVAVLESSDAKGRSATITAVLVDGKYPDTGMVIPNNSAFSAVATLSVEYMLQILKYADSVGAESVHIGLRGAIDPVEVVIPIEDERCASLVLIPQRHSGAINFLSGTINVENK